jgi:hypothetical protein
MTNRARLDRLEAALAGPGEGSADPCPTCGAWRIVSILREAAALVRELPPHIRYADPAKEPDAEAERIITEAAQEAAERQKGARCRRCGAPTLLALSTEDL